MIKFQTPITRMVCLGITFPYYLLGCHRLLLVRQSGTANKCVSLI